MKASIVIDDCLLDEAFNLTDIKTKTDLIKAALEEFVANRKKKI